ncbi:MAG: transporter [Bacteroides sp]|nr:transporter [Bacteroides sp.]
MKKFLLIGATALMVSNSTFAGGILTNTNQNAAYLRNPARDAVIAIDGVYSNPAGIAFLPQGFHLSISWQAAFQKRQIDATGQLFQLNGGKTDKYFEGTAKAPVIPSFQAAYVINDKWSVSAQFAIGGGGGKCEFDNGLPMFEELVGGKLAPQIAGNLAPYAMSQNLVGEQYIYGFQVGGTYRIADNFSVFGGVRGVLANCGYEGSISNISIGGNNAAFYANAMQQAAAGAQQAAAAGNTGLAAELQAQATAAGTAAFLMGDYVLDCSQSGFGITPIIGLDWNLGKLNLAAKYEFRTKINLENEADNSENVIALAKQPGGESFAQYLDGNKVRSDIPALLTLGAQYQFTDAVRAMAGFHYYWDKDAKGSPIKNGKNTWEALLGIEWDMNDKIMLSLGGQRTDYNFADSDMVDTNFNTPNYAVCLGGAYKFSEKMKLNVGYMHSFYEDHKVTSAASGVTRNYTRKNDVVGVSLDIAF